MKPAFSFCFSAARRLDHLCTQAVVDAGVLAGILFANAAPPKNKRKLRLHVLPDKLATPTEFAA